MQCVFWDAGTDINENDIGRTCSTHGNKVRIKLQEENFNAIALERLSENINLLFKKV
jgi:hypothetical protein